MCGSLIQERTNIFYASFYSISPSNFCINFQWNSAKLKAIIEVLRMQTIGGLKCGLDIWELAIVPSLINNCSTWTQISTESIDKLNKLQYTFLQMLFAVSQSCPKPVLCWDTATILMQVRIQKSKLALLHHIKNLDESSLAKQIFRNLRAGRAWLLKVMK